MRTRLKAFLGRREPASWAVLLLMLAAGGVAGHYLAHGDLWVSLRSKIFQGMSGFGRQPRFPQHTATVLLDDGDFWSAAPSTTIPTDPPGDLAGRSPTNRIYLARLIRKLDAAGAPVIALDIDLRSPSATILDFADFAGEDTELFSAIRDACAHHHRVVLASELISSPAGAAQAPALFDKAAFDPDCVSLGYIQLPTDIRRVPVTFTLASGSTATPFALAAAAAAATESATQSAQRTDFPYSEFIPLDRFRDTTQPRNVFSGRDILTLPATDLAPRVAGRIALIGGDWHTLAVGQGPWVDRHPSPGGDLPGVLLHANYMEAALAHKLVPPFPDALGELLDAILVLILAVVGMLEISLAMKWTAVAVTCLVVMVFSYLMLQTFGIFLDFFFPLILLGIHAAFEHLQEWRHPAHAHTEE